MRPVIDRTYHVGIGRHAENLRIRRGNLAVDYKWAAELKTMPAGSKDLFGRTLEELEGSIATQERQLAIAEIDA